jgi:methylated-DNA-[protein]-cysteine S-methyltransferase
MDKAAAVACLEWVERDFAGDLRLRLVASGRGVRAIEFHPEGTPLGAENERNPLLRETVRQLESYFARDLRCFELELDMAGTEFQKRVWLQLLTIPYGETCSYSELARGIGSPAAVRAVGAANGANPIPIVVPCHRLIGSSGRLVGYGGGLPLKRRLLELERGGLFV